MNCFFTILFHKMQTENQLLNCKEILWEILFSYLGIIVAGSYSKFYLTYNQHRNFL